MTPNAYHKLTASRARWRKTTGEHVLRLAGIALALVALAVGVKYGLDYGWEPAGPPAPYQVKRTDAALPKHVLFVAPRDNDAAEGFAEALRSYFGAKVNTVAPEDLHEGALAGMDCAIVFSDGSAGDNDPRGALLSAAAAQQLPIVWIGSGLARYTPLLGLARFEEEPERTVPPNSFLTYKGTDTKATGLAFIPGYPQAAGGEAQVLATVRLHDTFLRPAAVRSGPVTYLAFNPFPRSGAPYALAVAIDIVSDILGRHRPDPRVVFRLEDINGRDYGPSDTSFRRTAQKLVEEEVFAHVAITPDMVDANGNFVADLSNAQDVLTFLKQHPSLSAVVQHGTKHYRRDPRNAGKPSGLAYEFFFDDDQTMGRAEATRFARDRLIEGYEMMTKAGLDPLMFEAPHLEMSPGEEAAARSLFPVMMHPPLFFGSHSEQFSMLVPWITERDGTVYAPHDVGYVDALDERSVQKILLRLERLKRILPDPIAVVFFHPFMIDRPGREDDLAELIDGIKRLGYRPVSLLDQVEPIPQDEKQQH
jgi:hypothetical protein